MKLNKIELEAFRGSTQPLSIDLSASKPIVLLFGENGTGKTSIVDAIDFVCNRNIGIKEARSSVRAKHLPSLGRKAAEVRAKVVAGDLTFSANLTGESVSGDPANGQPRVQILRRDRIHLLVAAPPAERYKQLREFVTIPFLDSSEAALRTACLNAGNDYDAKTATVADAQAVIEKQWKEAGSLGETPLAWAEGLKSGLANELRKRQNKGRTIATALSTAGAQCEGLRRAQAEADATAADLKAAHEGFEKLASQSVQGADHLLHILQATLSFLDAAGPDPCPVCESSAGTAGLKERVQQRVAALETLAAAAERIRSHEGTMARQTGAIESAGRAFVASLRILKKHLRTSPVLPSGATIDWTQWPGLDVEDGEDPVDQALSLWAILEAEAPAVEAKIGHLEKEATRSSLAKEALERLREAEAKAADLFIVSSKMEGLLGIVSDERKKHVDAVLDEISASVNDMYGFIHPAEPLGDLRFFLDPKQQGSLNLESTFAGAQQVPPQAYFSDSHLDTLGICLFLAIALRDPKPIVVLDDVLTSADAQHTERFLDLLLKNAGDFGQLILTSHYRPLLERLKRQGSSSVDVIELAAWSPEKGIRHAATRIRAVELRSLIDEIPFNREAAASKAGIFVEEVLDRLTLTLKLKTARGGKGELTIGQLAEGISSKVAKFVVATPKGGLPVPIGELLRKIADMKDVRNQVGSHFSLAGMFIPDQDVLIFCADVLRVVEAFFCPACASPPDKNKNGGCWECGCGQRQLAPLVMPS